jgi:hypothetical protein
MAFEDRYGLPVSASNAAAAHAYLGGIDLMLSAWPGPRKPSTRRSKPILISHWLMRPAHGPI